MTKSEFLKLRRGDLVRNLAGGWAFVLDDTIWPPTSELPIHIAIRTVTVTNPSEWELVDKKG